MNCLTIICKLIGPFLPTGDSEIDRRGHTNMGEAFEVVNGLVADIIRASESKDRHQVSMRRIGKDADEFLNELQQWLEERKEEG